VIAEVTPHHLDIAVGWSTVRVLRAPLETSPSDDDDDDPPPNWDWQPGMVVATLPERRALPWRRVTGTLRINHQNRGAGVEGGSAALELDSGALRVLLGSVDPSRSHFHRMTRACRQPGSVFKPVLYSLALEQGYTAASMIDDTPFRRVDALGRPVERIRNADRAYRGAMTMMQALASSRNVPAVRFWHALGADAVTSHARRLGLRGDWLTLDPRRLQDATATGAHCVIPLDMIKAYGAFTRQGQRLEPFLIQTIRDRAGHILWDAQRYNPTQGSAEMRVHRLQRWDERLEEAPQVLTPEAAFIMRDLLSHVVSRGTASDARQLPFAVAGKTGTTTARSGTTSRDAIRDVWFIGFTEHVLAGVWLGEDNSRQSLGRGVQGGRQALAAWSVAMRAMMGQRLGKDLLGPTPPKIVYQRIDPVTGQRAHPKGASIRLPMVRGTEPRQQASSRATRAAQQADIRDRDF